MGCSPERMDELLKVLKDIDVDEHRRCAGEGRAGYQADSHSAR